MNKFWLHQKIEVLCVISFLFSFQVLLASDEVMLSGVRSFSLGNIRATSDELLNPAVLSFSEQRKIGLSVFNQFQMSELNTATLYWTCPNPLLDIGFRAATFGYEDYRITQFQGGFSKQIVFGFAIGIQLNYLHESSILDEESHSAFSSGLGIYHRFNEKLTWALLGENLLGTSKTPLYKLAAGIQYCLSDDVTAFLETGYGKEKAGHCAVGLEYRMLDALVIRSGYHSGANRPAFGIAYLWKRWTVEAGFSTHSVLGMSSMIGVSYEL